MERISCTTPFGLELDNICTEQNKSLEAYEFFKDVLFNKKEVKECPYPCNFLISRITTTDYNKTISNSDDRITLNFDKYISHHVHL